MLRVISVCVVFDNKVKTKTYIVCCMKEKRFIENFSVEFKC